MLDLAVTVASASVKDKVLVVDDDTAFHRLVEGILAPAGIACVYARSGEEALRLVEEGKPRVLIIDGLLPGIRGDAVVAAMRKMWSPVDLPVIFVSAFFRDAKSRQALLKTAKVNAVLHKPVQAEELRAELARIPGLVADMGDDDGVDIDIDLAMASELLTDFLVIATERLSTLRQNLADLSTEQTKAAIASLRTEAHRFRGTGSSFGLPEVTRLGGQIEDLLEAQKNAPMTPALRAHLRGLVAALEVKLARAGASIPSPGTPGAARALKVVLIDSSGELATSCSAAMANGAPIRLFSSAADAVGALAEDAADVVFLAFDRPQIDPFEACGALAAAGVGPLVAMGGDSSVAQRLKVGAKGARGHVHRLADVASLMKAAFEFAPTPRGVSAVAVSLDHGFLGRLAETASAEGIAVTPCTEPQELFDTLDRSTPAVLFVDSQLQGVGGLQLVKAVRADIRHRDVPVITFSQSDSLKGQLEAFEAGADDAMPLDFAKEVLAAKLRAIVRRRAPALRSSSPPFEPCATPEALAVELDRALVLAQRGRPLSLLMFVPVVDSLRASGRLAVDAAVDALGARLRAGFRTSDFIARLDATHFAIVLYDAPQAEARRLLDQHLMRFRGEGAFAEPFIVPVKGAVASFPEVAGGAAGLLQAARAGLSAAPVASAVPAPKPSR